MFKNVFQNYGWLPDFFVTFTVYTTVTINITIRKWLYINLMHFLLTWKFLHFYLECLIIYYSLGEMNVCCPENCNNCMLESSAFLGSGLLLHLNDQHLNLLNNKIVKKRSKIVLRHPASSSTCLSHLPEAASKVINILTF